MEILRHDLKTAHDFLKAKSEPEQVKLLQNMIEELNASHQSNETEMNRQISDLQAKCDVYSLLLMCSRMLPI